MPSADPDITSNGAAIHGVSSISDVAAPDLIDTIHSADTSSDDEIVIIDVLDIPVARSAEIDSEMEILCRIHGLKRVRIVIFIILLILIYFE